MKLAPLARHHGHVIGAVFLAALLATLYATAARQDVFRDFAAHARFAEVMAQDGTSPPHFLYHLLAILVRALTSSSLLSAGYLVAWACVLASFLIAYRYMVAGITSIPRLSVGVLCIPLFLFHPLPVAYAFDRHLYLGYIAANVFHNPTIILLKPLALLHFFYMTGLLAKGRLNFQQAFNLGLLTALSLLAKPSYVLSLLPALLAFWAFSRTTRRSTARADQQVIVYSTFLPAAALLSGQFLHTYALPGDAGVGIAPLALFRVYSSLPSLLPKLAASLVFPLLAGVFFFKRLRIRADVQLAVLNLGFALAYNYILVEKGGRMAHGNFTWSSQIALLILVMVCMRALLQRLDRARAGEALSRQERLGLRLSMSALGLHYAAGILWFASNVASGGFQP